MNMNENGVILFNTEKSFIYLLQQNK